MACSPETLCRHYCYIKRASQHETLIPTVRILPSSERTAHRRLVLVMAFLCTFGWVAPLFHHHPHDVRSVADASLAAHTCGEVEHHIPLDASHGCEICWQTGQRVSLPAAVQTAVAPVPVPGVVNVERQTLTHHVSQLVLDKRGPPAVA